MHGTYNAVDYSWSPDPTIYAPEDGKITSQFTDPSCGTAMHLTGATGRHGFCHLERYLVSNGVNVVKGQPIGIMGYTGYTIPSGPAGRHLHWVLYRNGVYVYPPNYVNERNDMSTTDLYLARVLAHGVLGRNGYNGKPNALDGSQDADLLKNHVGKETNAKIWEFYNSAEGKDWRDNLQPKAYAQRDAYKRQLDEVTADRNGLIVKYDAEKAKNAQLTEENAQLQITVNEQKQTIAQQEAKIKELEDQLANSTPTDPDAVVITKDSLWARFKAWWNKE